MQVSLVKNVKEVFRLREVDENALAWEILKSLRALEMCIILIDQQLLS